MKESPENERFRGKMPPRHPYMNNDRLHSLEVRNAVDYIQKIKSFYSEGSPIFIKFLEAMKNFKQSRLTGPDLFGCISQLFAEHPILIQEFKSFIPGNHFCNPEEKKERNNLPERINPQERVNVPERPGLDFLPQPKRLCEKEAWNKFKEVIFQLKKKLTPQRVNELHSLICENTEILIRLNKVSPEEKEDTPFEQIKNKLKSMNVYKEFMKCINSYNQNLISKNDLIFLIKQIIKEDDLVNEFVKYLNPSNSYERPKKPFIRAIGSYRIVKNEPTEALLNDICVLCPTHEREDEQYVFLKRSVYEENIFKVEDERYEIDLLITRIEFFIISLEKILLSEREEMSVKDFEMSYGVIQNILELVYSEHGNEILEAILLKPKQIIPIVLKRLYKINKKIKKEKIEKEAIWDEVTTANHYKALDSTFCDFKNLDKKNLMTKNLINNHLNKELDLSNLEKIKQFFIKMACITFSNKENCIILQRILDLIAAEHCFYAPNQLFCIFSFIFILTERFSEIYEFQIDSHSPSTLSRELGLNLQPDILNCKDEIFLLIQEFLENKIDSSLYESQLRVASKNYGYKLFNVDKIFTKLENKINSLVEEFDSEYLEIILSPSNSPNSSREFCLALEEYFFIKITNNVVLMCKIVQDSINKDEILETVEKFKNLDYDSTLITYPVFLKRSIVNYEIGVFNFTIEHVICGNTRKLRYVVGGVDLFMRAEYRRMRNKEVS